MTDHTRPNPARPYKAIAAAVAAALLALVAEGTDVFPAWLLVVAGAIAVGLLTFTTPAD